MHCIARQTLCQLAVLTAAFGYSCDHNAYKVLTLSKTTDSLIHSTRILYPANAGSYPVFIWLHGWQLEGANYDEILCDAAKSSIIICMQMDPNFVGEQLNVDAELLLPYLHDPRKGILPKIGSSAILHRYSYTYIGLGGHSRGGGVIAYAYSHGIIVDADFSAVVFVDAVTALKSDVPNVVRLNKTIVRAMYFNDAHSSCVVNGWPQFGDKFNCKEINVIDAGSVGCQHMDIVSGLASLLPVCHSNLSTKEVCKAKARREIASAGFGPVVVSVLV